MSERTRVLYLAPWVDYGGSDKGTIDWFRWLDRTRFAASLVTTQPSDNRRLAEVLPYAEEAWPLPDLIAGQHMPGFVFDFIATRGVELLHIMNSRLAYELLPDLSALPHRPRVVVQLHVEEEDRSGYVRLVSRRYGNLVDAFSVSSEHLARIVEGYDVPRSKIHVIPTGVDAETEFAPDRVLPVGGLEPGAVHVLYPGRLVDQKDPLLMVEVAARAVAARGHLRVHVVGDGPLEPAVREAIAARGLERHVLLHPPTPALAGWYAACDALLMTSTFEGVPYVLYEAMAMGLPSVVPALPGNRELFRGGGGGELIEPRDDAAAYAEALLRLVDDADRRRAVGAVSRERALGELSVKTMAARHEELYALLLEGAQRPPRPLPHYVAHPATLPARPRAGTPLVSVIVPCFNDGRYLATCLEAIEAQTHPALEIFVVDDASTDPDTRRLLDELDRSGRVTLLRMPRNGGPSRARNAALELVRGRYVLPVDADNILLTDAIERLVQQLSEAGPDVGFVYPNLQYFGNRRDYFEAPEYNLAELLEGNFCDTCSLFDARLFEQGLRFREEIKLGHEDWSLVLDLAARGIRGEPARGPTLLYRKAGFTRSDLVEYGHEPFAEAVRAMHPELFGRARPGRWGDYAGEPVSVKAKWSPGMSIVTLEPVEPGTEAGGALWRRLLAQTCADFELVVRSHGDWPATGRAPAIRHVHAGLAASPADALADGLAVARAPVVLIVAGTSSDLLRDRGFVEKLLRILWAREGVDHVVLADAGHEGLYPMRRLTRDQAAAAAAHAVALRRNPAVEALPATALLDRDAPIESLVRLLVERPSAWHHQPRRTAPKRSGARIRAALAPRPPRNGAERAELDLRLQRDAAIPALPWNQVRRWTFSLSWMPPGTVPLVRHRQQDGERRVVTNSRTPPPGCTIEFDLGCLHRFQPPGTAELRVGGPEGFHTIPETDLGEPLLREPRHPDCLGFVEQAPFPLLHALEVGFHPPSEQWVLVSGPSDPLAHAVEQRRFLGFIEAFPNLPRLPEPELVPFGLVGLVRTVDPVARRHRYGAGQAPAGTVSLELGALHVEPQDGSVELRLHDGRVLADALRDGPPAAPPRVAARWAAAPLSWRGAGPLAPRARASARRTLEAVGRRRRGGDAGTATGEVAGYLWPDPAPGRVPVHGAVHPVTRDQLLTRWPLEAASLGYGPATLLGWACAMPLVTGSLDPLPVDVPWASRFGRRVRRT